MRPYLTQTKQNNNNTTTAAARRDLNSLSFVTLHMLLPTWETQLQFSVLCEVLLEPWPPLHHAAWQIHSSFPEQLRRQFLLPELVALLICRNISPPEGSHSVLLTSVSHQYSECFIVGALEHIVGLVCDSCTHGCF